MEIDAFFKYLEVEKRYAKHTQTAYIQDLNQFFSFLDSEYPDTPVGDLTHFEIRSWMVFLLENNLEPRSIHRKVSTLRTYFKYLKKHGFLSKSPLINVRLPKKAKPLPVFLQEKPLHDLLDGFQFTDDHPGRRDRLMIEFFYCSGVRLSELVGLKVANLDFEAGQVKVLGKRSKERIIPIPSSSMAGLKWMVQENARAFAVQEARIQGVFLTDTGRPVYPKWVYRKVTHYLSKVSTAEKVSPHILRHTFATHLLNRGADLNAIKELLGHSSLAATEVYTHNSIERLKLIYSQAHPKA